MGVTRWGKAGDGCVWHRERVPHTHTWGCIVHEKVKTTYIIICKCCAHKLNVCPHATHNQIKISSPIFFSGLESVQSKDREVPKNEVFMLTCEPTSNISNIFMQLWRRKTRFKNVLWEKCWLWWWWERIHTKGARAAPRWPPWQPRTPFPCSDVSSSPFSASSPTRQTRLRTSEIHADTKS